MDFLYADLNEIVDPFAYSVEETDNTVRLSVDNDKRVIQASVVCTPGKMTIENGKNESIVFDGSQDRILQIPEYKITKLQTDNIDIRSQYALMKWDHNTKDYVKVDGDTIQLEEQIDELNIANGQGKYSIIQKGDSNHQAKSIGYGSIAFSGFRGDKPLDEPDPIPENDKNTTEITDIDTITVVEGIQSAAFGAGNRAYGNWNFIAGKDNKTFQRGSFAFGGKNAVGNPSEPNAYCYSIAVGESNTVTGRSCFVGGDQNDSKAKAQYGIVYGRNNISEGIASIIVGASTTMNHVTTSAAFGDGHVVNNSCAFVSGVGNKTGGYASSALGGYLTTNTDYQTVVGVLNNPSPDAMFIVGNGINTNNPKNIFEVLKDGHAKVGRSTIDTDSDLTLVTKDYVDEKVENVGGVDGVRDYDSIALYNYGDIVYYEGNLYSPLVDGVTGILPTDTSKWRVLVEASGLVFSRNLFDKNAATVDRVLNPNSGYIDTANGFYVSDYIEVEVGKTYSLLTSPNALGTNASRLTVYDSNKEFNGNILGTLVGNILTVTIDYSQVGNSVFRKDIKYIRYTVTKSELDSSMFVEGAEYPEEYEEFGVSFLSKETRLSLPQLEQAEQYIKNLNDDNGSVSAEQLYAELDKKADNLTVNLFNKDTITEGVLNNGKINSVSGFWHSDYIEIEVGKTYTFYISVAAYGETIAKKLEVYSADKTYNGYIPGTLSGNILTVTIDYSWVGNSVFRKDIKYCRINMGNYFRSVMFVEGDTYPEEYFEYGKKYLGEDVNLRKFHIAQIPPVDSPLKGKKIVYNGDSICEGRVDESSTSYNGGAYAKIIADLTGGTFENRGRSGGILASAVPSGNTPARTICTDIANMAEDADLVCFEGGINDYWLKVPLGEFSASDFTSEVDTTTVTGALESIFRQSINKWVGKPICFIIVHKITTTVYNENSAGYTFAQARERMIEVCEKYSIPYFDAFAKSGLNPYMQKHNETYMTSNSTGNPDGCHPNEVGYRLYYVPQLIKFFEGLIQ